MSQEIENNVDAILQAEGITMTCVYAGFEMADGDTYGMDKWRITFTKGVKNAVVNNKVTETFDYSTGIGHRAPPSKIDTLNARGKLGPSDKKNNTIWYQRVMRELEATRKPQAPKAASVLYCLISDASASEMSFDDWCGEFGYDTDSRKALETYMACQANHTKLCKLLTLTVRHQISALLQDY